MLAGSCPVPELEARPLPISPAPNLRKPVLAFSLCGGVLLVPLALSVPGGAPGAGEEVVLSAGSPGGARPEQVGGPGETFGSELEAEFKTQAQSSAVTVEAQPAIARTSSTSRSSVRTATTARGTQAARATTTTSTTTSPKPRAPVAAIAARLTVGSAPFSAQPPKPPPRAPEPQAPAPQAPAPRAPASQVPTSQAPTSKAPAPLVTSSSDAVWDRLAQCESGNTNDAGAPYYGYWQFSAETWQGMGEVGLPNEHSRERQLAVAKRLQAARGWKPWPGCSRLLGLL